MKYSDFLEAAEEAENTLRRAERMVERLLPFTAKGIENMKDHSSARHLAILKAKLKDFDSRTLTWKNK